MVQLGEFKSIFLINFTAGIPSNNAMSHFNHHLPLLPDLSPKTRDRWTFKLQLGLLLVGLVSLSACAASQAQSSKSNGKGKRPVPVLVKTVEQKNVPLQVKTTGTVEAYSTVAVKAQVGGQITGVYFQQGQTVNRGDLLFKIDCRALEASRQQAEANKAKDIAKVQQAKATVAKESANVKKTKADVAQNIALAGYTDVQAERYTRLYQQGAISKSQADLFQSNAVSNRAGVSAVRETVASATAQLAAAQADVLNAQAAVAADDAAIASAKVQLSYSAIYSPIEGRTGSLKLTQGNLIKANGDEPLVVISQIRPVYVAFSIPQRLLPDLKKYSTDRALPVEAFLPKEAGKKDPGQAVRGKLTFVDAVVNAQTGTVQLKGTFQNAEERLAPGQFVEVVLKLKEERHAIVVPTPAIQTGQKGKFVFVVKANQTVDVRSVVVGSALGKETVIKEGLSAGEKVVIDGQFNLTPGAKVDIKTDQIKSDGDPHSKQQGDKPESK
jgi:multidrug efflux system membrane fusion protein